MIHLLEDYIWRSLPEGPFLTNPRLREKVDASGKLKPFFGNTVVYLLEEENRRRIAAFRDSLYRKAGDMLAEPLETDSFHMTLHDLANGSPYIPGLMAQMLQAEKGAKAVLSQWKDLKPVRMGGTWIFNMVNSSIVLGLRPLDDSSWQQLSNCYRDLNQVVPLDYKLCPHITLAYFRPGAYGPERLTELRKALGPAEIELTLQPQHLALQYFKDMNTYITMCTWE